MAAHTGSAVRDRAGAKYIKLSTGMGISCSAGLSKLKALHLSYSGVSSQDLRSLSSVCAGPNVTTLDVSGNPGVDDDGLIALLKACPNIDTIYAYDTKITDKSIEPEMTKRDIGLRRFGPSQLISSRLISQMKDVGVDVHEAGGDLLFTDITGGLCAGYLCC